MNRREAIVAGTAGLLAAVTGPPVASAQAAPAENPEMEPIRALLRAHDEAFTNQDLDAVLACFAEKAAIMGASLACFAGHNPMARISVTTKCRLILGGPRR